jgi:hypothetical protein
MDDLIIRIEKSIDEVLVTLRNVLVRLSSPQLTRNSEQHALSRDRSTGFRFAPIARRILGCGGWRRTCGTPQVLGFA